MGDKITLKVDDREIHGKKVAQLRREGLTPGVVYGPGIEPQSIQVPDGELKKVVSAAGKHTPVHLTGSKRRIAMVKEIDIDPAKNTIKHVSFHAVRADQPIVAEVPVRLTGEGESVAEKNGFIVLQTLDHIEVKALPMDLPEAVEVSILELAEEGEKLTLAAAKLPENVEFVEHDDGHHEQDDEAEQRSVLDNVVASVWEPAALQAANEAAAGSASDESEVASEHGEAEADAEEAPAETSDKS